MLKIFLARHAQDQDNALDIINGLRDLPLSSLGVLQAKKLARFFLKKQLRFNKVYASPLVRAKQTADIISSFSFQVEYEVLDLLIERDFGILTGKSRFDIPKYCKKTEFIKNNNGYFFFNCGSAESIDSVAERARLVISYLNQRFNDGMVLLVSHGVFAQVFYSVYYQIPLEQVVKKIHLNNTDVLLFQDPNKEPANPFYYKSSLF
ncbi:MAG: hypothetical protein KatS3mg090_0127 [Patescibacteria group bacterium]|nr:MAG: hypothetical protein KatS3mg090_0127 [Patescibacteria group bacterium]